MTTDPTVSGPDLRVRTANGDDATMLLTWRNDPEVRRWSRSTGEIDLPTHLAWLTRALADRGRHVLVVAAAADGTPVATTRYDLLGAADGNRARWEVSIVVAPGMRGRGLGGAVLSASDAWLRAVEPEAREIVAHVRPENVGSRRVFERNGYRDAPSAEQELDCLVRTLDRS